MEKTTEKKKQLNKAVTRHVLRFDFLGEAYCWDIGAQSTLFINLKLLNECCFSPMPSVFPN